MIDRDFIELAALDAVALLDGEDQEAFDHECRINPELRTTSAEMANLVAAVAVATTPPAPLPPQALADIYARIAPRPESAAARPPRGAAARGARSVLPWAAAAGFALLATWQGWRASSFASSLAEGPRAGQAGAPASGEAGDPESSDPMARPSPDTSEAEAGTTPGRARPPRGFLSNRPGSPIQRMQQDNERLRAEVARLEAAEGIRQGLKGRPSTAELNLIEMLPPGVKVAETAVPLADRAAQALAAGMQSPEDPPQTTTDTGSKDEIKVTPKGTGLQGDVVVDDPTQVPNPRRFNLGEGDQLRHSNFPPRDQWENLGLQPLDANTVFDSKNYALWHQSPDSSEWLAQIPPDNFIPDPSGSYDAPSPSAPNGTPTDNTASAPPPAPSSGFEGGYPYALPIIDEQGRGTLIVQNLPPAPEGEVYQLWMRDARSSTPIQIATLQSPSQGFGHFSFNAAGFLPSSYLMTREKAGQITTPSGTVILKGPPDK